MKSPSSALVWEIWRKNRWGFALLMVLFTSCAIWSVVVHHLQERARQLEAGSVMSGTLTASQVLPIAHTGNRERVVRFKLNSTVVYEGPFSPKDKVSWTGDETHLRLRLNSTNLFEGTGLPQGDRLSWAVVDGDGKGVVMLRAYRDVQSASVASSVAEDWREAGVAWNTALMGFSVLVLFVIFGGTEPQEGRGFTGVPPRRFTLPVTTTTLVVWPMLLGSLSIVVLVVAWSRFVFPHLLPESTQMPEAYIALLFLAGLAVFQAIIWGLPSFPKTRVVLLTALISALLGLAIFRFSNPLDSLSALQIVCAVSWSWLLGTMAAWLGVRQERRGAWAGWQRRSVIGNLVRKLTPRPRSFRSALHAQVWFEWNRNCRLPLLVWTLLVWLVFGAVFMQSTAPSAFRTAFTIALFVSACFLVITGLNLARDGTSKKLALSSFTATRPVPTGSLATAKLLAGLSTWFLAILVLGCTALVAAGASGLNLSFEPGNAWPSVRELLPGTTLCLLWLAVSLHIFIGILPLCLSGKIPGFPWSLLPLLLIIGGTVNGWLWFARHQWPQNLLCALLSAMVVVKLIVAFWGFRRAIACRLVSRAFVRAYVALWLIATGVFLFMVRDFLVAFSGNIPNNEIITACVLAALLAVPLARIALSPVALALNRHR